MDLLIIVVLISIITIVTWVLWARRDYNQAVEAGDIVPGPGARMGVDSAAFGQFVTVNLTMMSGGVVMGNWNDKRTKFTVTVSKPNEDGQRQITQFIDKIQGDVAKADPPVNICLKWMQ